MRPAIRLLAALAIASGLTPAASAQPSPGWTHPAQSPLDALLAQARSRMREADASAAYALLSDRIDLYAGNPDFDYLLGISALDAGHPGAAILAFERVLTVRPDHLQARAELGRAYLLGGERENARRAFRDVASRDIPVEARRLIGRYLDAIAQLDAAHRVVTTGSVGLEIGYDDNANFGSASTSWLLGDGTPVVPLPVSLPKRSAVIGLDGGVSMSGPMDGRWRWIAGLHGAVRRYPSATTLDQEQIDVSGGLTRAQGCQQISLLAQYQNLRLDGAAFRDATGVLAQWQCDVNRRWNVGAYLQTFSLTYPGQSVRDARRNAVGASFAHALASLPDAIVSGSLQFGAESADPAWPNLSHRFAGARASLNLPVAPNWRAEAALAWELRDFDGPEPLFGTTRHDTQTEIRIGAERWLGDGWTVQPQLSWTRNASTLAPNDFRRTQLLVRVRYRF